MKNIINTLLFLVCFGSQTYSQNINQELLDAIKLNSYGEVTNLITKGADVNMADENGASALMWAVFKSDLNMVKLLVSHGAKVTKKGVIYLDDSKTGYYGSPLCIAAGEGKLDILKYIHEECKIPVDDREFNPSDSKENGWTALQWACNNVQSYGTSEFDFSKEKTENYSDNNMTVVKYLLQNGANINQNESEDENTPLLLAMRNQKWDLVDLILNNNPDIKLKNKEGNSPLHLAALYSKFMLVLNFLNQKDDSNRQNNRGYTPMMYCVSGVGSTISDKIITIRLLYTFGAKTDLVNSEGNSAISIANQKGDKEVIEYIQNPSLDYVLWFLMGKENEAIVYAKSDQFIPNQRYIQNYSFLDVASLRNDTALMKILISKGEKFDVPGYNGYSSLMNAVQFGKDGGIDAINLLIKSGANVNFQIAPDEFKTKGMTALHVASLNGKSKAVKTLIENNSNVNIVDDSGFTPLHYAIREGYLDISKLLIENGADINKKINSTNLKDWTPLMLAAYNNYTDLVKLLLYYHADLDVRNNNGKTAFDFAKEKNNFRIIKLLTEKKLTDADLAEIGIYSEEKIIDLISHNKFNINEKNDNGLTILHIAALKNMNYLTEYMSNNKLVAPDVIDNSDFTPLHYATREGRLYIAKLLVEHGADVNKIINTKELAGWTPLMFAAYNKQNDIVKLLVYNKVDVNIKNNEGKSALDIAKSQNATEVIGFLNKPELTLFDLVSIGYVKDVVAQIETKSIDVNIKDKDNNSLLAYILNYLNDYYNHYKENKDEGNSNVYRSLLQNMMEKSIYAITVTEGDYPAYNKGLRGEYYVLGYGDYEINGPEELFSYFRKIVDKSKTLTLLKDGKIESYAFESGKMGMQLNAKSISTSEKHKIISDYETWKHNNK